MSENMQELSMTLFEGYENIPQKPHKIDAKSNARGDERKMRK